MMVYYLELITYTVKGRLVQITNDIKKSTLREFTNKISTAISLRGVVTI